MAKLTPMMAQYFEIKQRLPECILFYQMGDFYEMFFEDAQAASPVLEIALTSRGRLDDKKIPMCGVPLHAADAYIAKLIKKNFKVAVCDQVEDPAQAKGLVKREVRRIVTPGMRLGGGLEDPQKPTFLAALVTDGKPWPEAGFGLAALEISTGDFQVMELSGEQALISEMSRLAPAETLISDDNEELKGFLADMGRYYSLREPQDFSREQARRALLDHFDEHRLNGFGVLKTSLGLRAAGAALNYAQENQGRTLEHLDRIRCRDLADHLILDDVAQRNLELFQNLRDFSRTGSLLGLMDRTRTAMGARKLREWMAYPLMDRTGIGERHMAIESLLSGDGRRERLAQVLGRVADIERLTSRIAMNRAQPRDLVALKTSLALVPEIKELLVRARLDGRLLDLGYTLDELTDVTATIEEAVVEEPPASFKDGGLFRRGFNPALDELIEIMEDGKGWISRLQAQERVRTGISSLKIGFNKVFGYYLEVTKANAQAVPESYIRKQTLVNCERYITPELKEQEERVLNAEGKRIALEQELFGQLRKTLAQNAPRMMKTADILAEIDVLCSLAQVARENGYTRPQLIDEDVIDIQAGRHPVVEKMLPAHRYVPNDIRLDMDQEQILLITGPNMAGKSTILRQAALIALMCQMGSFVPAARASLGLVDRIFTRVGATDDLSRGRSTFMVEMNETALILNQATPRSLVILDEIGRGTSTFDGLSIAWAVVEYLHDLAGRGVRALFATHYHELTELALTKQRVRNYNVAVKEFEGEIIFLHKLKPGGASRSYGLAVARLAGLPEGVILRGQEILENLEREEITPQGLPRPAASDRPPQPAAGQMSLFSPRPSRLAAELMALELDSLTPLAALNALAKLQKTAKNEFDD